MSITTVASFSSFANVNDGGTRAWTNPSNAATSNNTYAVAGSGQVWGPNTSITSQLLRSSGAPTWSAGTPGDIVSATVVIEASNTVSPVCQLHEVGWWSDTAGARQTVTNIGQNLTASDVTYNVTITLTIADLLSPNFYIDCKVRSNSGGSSGSSSGKGPQVDYLGLSIVTSGNVSGAYTAAASSSAAYDNTIPVSGSYSSSSSSSAAYDGKLYQLVFTDTGWLTPSTTTDAGSSWANPSNSQVEDGSFTTAAITGWLVGTSELALSNFGASIPVDSDITKVEITAIGSQTKSPGISGTTYGNVDPMKDVSLTPGSSGTTTIGNLFGNVIDYSAATSDGVALADWTPADFNASSFGFHIKAPTTSDNAFTGGTVTTNIDVFCVRVTYSNLVEVVPGTTGSYTASSTSSSSYTGAAEAFSAYMASGISGAAYSSEAEQTGSYSASSSSDASYTSGGTVEVDGSYLSESASTTAYSGVASVDGAYVSSATADAHYVGAVPPVVDTRDGGGGSLYPKKRGFEALKGEVQTPPEPEDDELVIEPAPTPPVITVEVDPVLVAEVIDRLSPSIADEPDLRFDLLHESLLAMQLEHAQKEEEAAAMLLMQVAVNRRRSFLHR